MPRTTPIRNASRSTVRFDEEVDKKLRDIKGTYGLSRDLIINAVLWWVKEDEVEEAVMKYLKHRREELKEEVEKE